MTKAYLFGRPEKTAAALAELEAATEALIEAARGAPYGDGMLAVSIERARKALAAVRS